MCYHDCFVTVKSAVTSGFPAATEGCRALFTFSQILLAQGTLQWYKGFGSRVSGTAPGPSIAASTRAPHVLEACFAARCGRAVGRARTLRCTRPEPGSLLGGRCLLHAQWRRVAGRYEGIASRGMCVWIWMVPARTTARSGKSRSHKAGWRGGSALGRAGTTGREVKGRRRIRLLCTGQLPQLPSTFGCRVRAMLGTDRTRESYQMASWQDYSSRWAKQDHPANHKHSFQKYKNPTSDNGLYYSYKRCPGNKLSCTPRGERARSILPSTFQAHVSWLTGA